jgi:hypothetical protein
MAPRRKLHDEDIESELIYDINSDENVEDTESDEDEDDCDDEQQPSPPVLQQQIMKWGLQSQANQKHVHKFIGGDRGKKQNEAPQVNKDLKPLNVLMLYLASVSDLLVTETHRYYHQCLDRRDKTPDPLPDLTNFEMFLFLAIVQMNHDV